MEKEKDFSIYYPFDIFMDNYFIINRYQENENCHQNFSHFID